MKKIIIDGHEVVLKERKFRKVSEETIFRLGGYSEYLHRFFPHDGTFARESGKEYVSEGMGGASIYRDRYYYTDAYDTEILERIIERSGERLKGYSGREIVEAFRALLTEVEVREVK